MLVYQRVLNEIMAENAKKQDVLYSSQQELWGNKPKLSIRTSVDKGGSGPKDVSRVRLRKPSLVGNIHDFGWWFSRYRSDRFQNPT